MILKVDRQKIRGGMRLVEVRSFCCDELEKAWEAEAIGFGDFNNGGRVGNDDVNIFDFYKDSYRMFPIKFCPFCAKPIVIKFSKLQLKEW